MNLQRNLATCICQRGENRASVLYIFASRHIGYVTSGVWGWGGGRMLTFMLTCGTCACHVMSGGWGHEACNYSKGIFCIKKRIGNKTVLIHTGGVDAMWKLSKSAIPCSLATRVNGQVNPKLMRSISVWQWRWLNSKENILEKTGRTLQKRMAM